MSALDLTTLSATSLQTDPYQHVVVPGLVRAEAIQAIANDFPTITKPGLFPMSVLQSGPSFRALIEELDGSHFENAISNTFGLTLSEKPKLFTVRGHCARRDGSIHTDSTSKVVTVLVYLNPGWEEQGGRLRVLRGPSDLSDFVSEIPPTAGTMFAFRRSDKSYHGHEPFEGERRAIQINWITDTSTRDRELARHNLSARLKRLNPFG